MFQLHPKKCRELRIPFLRSPAIRELVSLNETATIDLVKSVKVLRVIIQENLKWNQHVDATIKKAAKRLYFLMQLKRAHVPAKDLVCLLAFSPFYYMPAKCFTIVYLGILAQP